MKHNSYKWYKSGKWKSTNGISQKTVYEKRDFIVLKMKLPLSPFSNIQFFDLYHLYFFTFLTYTVCTNYASLYRFERVKLNMQSIECFIYSATQKLQNANKCTFSTRNFKKIITYAENEYLTCFYTLNLCGVFFGTLFAGYTPTFSEFLQILNRAG